MEIFYDSGPGTMSQNMDMGLTLIEEYNTKIKAIDEQLVEFGIYFTYLFY